MKINVALRRKDTCVETNTCSIDKAIELTEFEFNHFCKHLMQDYPFIQDNAIWMTEDENEVCHCLLVTGIGHDEGILVCSEGASYARYTAVVPQARQLLLPKRNYEPILQNFCDRMQAISDEVVKAALESNQDGMYHVFLSDYEPTENEYPMDRDLLYQMLDRKAEIQRTETFDDEILLQVKSEYITQETEPETEHLPLSQEEADIMCAKHLLWLHDEDGGVQADFSPYALHDLDLSHRRLNSAIFCSAKIIGTNFSESELCFANFEHTYISDCNLSNCDGEETNFKSTVIRNCNFEKFTAIHSNFKSAKIKSTSMNYANFKNACIEGIQLDDVTERTAILINCSNDEPTWSKPSEPVLSI